MVVISPEELSKLIEDAVARALERHGGLPGEEPDKPYLTLSEAARYLKRSTPTVRRYIAQGKLQASKVQAGSSRVMIARAALDHLLAVTTR